MFGGGKTNTSHILTIIIRDNDSLMALEITRASTNKQETVYDFLVRHKTNGLELKLLLCG